MEAGPRRADQRKADALARLTAPAVDVWVATAGSGGAHLVPLSLAWIADRAVIALAGRSRTATNLLTSGEARLAIGPILDVVMIDETLEGSVPVVDAPPELAERYVAQSDWDPRVSPDGYLFVTLRPVRVQAWRESNEIAGRTLMRDGAWLV